MLSREAVTYFWRLVFFPGGEEKVNEQEVVKARDVQDLLKYGLATATYDDLVWPTMQIKLTLEEAEMQFFKKLRQAPEGIPFSEVRGMFSLSWVKKYIDLGLIQKVRRESGVYLFKK